MKMAQYVDWIMQQVFECSDIDGWDAQDKAVEFGILNKVGYDPEKHRDTHDYEPEPGDEWFELSPEFKEMLAAEKAS